MSPKVSFEITGGGRAMMEQEWLARSAIEKTLAICAQAGDARKADAYAESFSLDAVLILEQTFSGREAIRAFMNAPSPIPPPDTPSPGFVSHHLTTCRIDFLNETSAKVRTYWLVITAAGPDHSGYYDDLFVQAENTWLIASRRPRVLWVSPSSLLL